MLNLVELLFLFMGFSAVLLGSLVNFLEPYLPDFVSTAFRYGKFGSDKKSPLVHEIPKSKFKHFYAFALIWGAGGFYLGICAYLTGRPIPGYVHSLLDLLVSKNREVKSKSDDPQFFGRKSRDTCFIPADEISTFVALFLIFLQIFRRFYETHFIQIFSKKSKINLSHYLVGYLHYYGVILAILAHAPGFVQGTPLSLIYLRQLIDIRIIICIVVFLYAWVHQFLSNLILINLRKNKSGTWTFLAIYLLFS